MGMIIQNGKQYFPVFNIPRLLHTAVVNRSSSSVSITYSPLRSGIQQFYIFFTENDLYETPPIDVLVNNVSVISNFTRKINIIQNNMTDFMIGEMYVEKGDTIIVRNTAGQSNRGIILFVLENANTNGFEVIGVKSNNNETFYIDNNTHVLECYNYGFYSSRTNYKYVLDPDPGQSVPTPNTSDYYYGGTFAIRV